MVCCVLMIGKEWRMSARAFMSRSNLDVLPDFTSPALSPQNNHDFLLFSSHRLYKVSYHTVRLYLRVLGMPVYSQMSASSGHTSCIMSWNIHCGPAASEREIDNNKKSHSHDECEKWWWQNMKVPKWTWPTQRNILYILHCLMLHKMITRVFFVLFYLFFVSFGFRLCSIVMATRADGCRMWRGGAFHNVVFPLAYHRRSCRHNEINKDKVAKSKQKCTVWLESVSDDSKNSLPKILCAHIHNQRWHVARTHHAI